MTDDIDELGEFETEDYSDSEHVDCEKCRVIAPRGWGWAADTLDCILLRVDYKTAQVEMLQAEYEDGVLKSQRWKNVEVKGNRLASVK